MLRLTLGEKPISTDNADISENSKSSQYFSFDLLYGSGQPFKRTKQRLANIALEEILGKDYSDMHEYAVGSVSQNDSEGTEDDLEDEEDTEDFVSDDTLYYDEEEDDDENVQTAIEDPDDVNFGSMSSIGYSWEIKTPVACKVDEYLGGLLWNLQTYQDGVCTNYGYNYGRRMSPTAKEIVEFFKEAQENNRTLDRSGLLGDESISPLNAGLSCLAALPSEVQHLVPEPYRQLSVNNSVEEIYASCMDPEANVFDIQMFHRLCMDRLQKDDADKIEKHQNSQNSTILTNDNQSSYHKDKDTSKGRTISTSDLHWTVFQKISKPLSHPFTPPTAFSPRMSKLKPNNRIKVSRILATNESRTCDKQKDSLDQNDFKFGDASGLLKNKKGREHNLDSLQYKKAYKNAKEDNSRLNGKAKSKQKEFSLEKAIDDFDKFQKETIRKNAQSPKRRHRTTDEVARMEQFKVIQPPTEAARNVEDQTAVQCLQRLKDSRLLSVIQWEWVAPSQTPYASFNPEIHETVKLTAQAAPATDENNILHAGPKEIILEQDRNINSVSRKILKQHIASIVIQQLLGSTDSWTEMTVNEMKEKLSLQTSVIP